MWSTGCRNDSPAVCHRGSAGRRRQISTEAVVRAPADGYTLLLVATATAINSTLYDKLSFNLSRDIAPVASIITEPLVLTVVPSVPAKTVPEFIDYVKANPGKINMASAGNGTPQHVCGELFKMSVDMVHVPYRGGAPAITDLLAGQVQVYFPGLILSMEYIKAGKIGALAVTTTKRSKALPDIPTVSDTLRGFEASQWFGLGAPKGTPAEVIGMLNKEVNAALADPTITTRLTELGSTVLLGSSADFGKLIAADTEKWGKLIRAANIKPA